MTLRFSPKNGPPRRRSACSAAPAPYGADIFQENIDGTEVLIKQCGEDQADSDRRCNIGQKHGVSYVTFPDSHDAVIYQKCQNQSQKLYRDHSFQNNYKAVQHRTVKGFILKKRNVIIQTDKLHGAEPLPLRQTDVKAE